MVLAPPQQKNAQRSEMSMRPACRSDVGCRSGTCHLVVSATAASGYAIVMEVHRGCEIPAHAGCLVSDLRDQPRHTPGTSDVVCLSVGVWETHPPHSGLERLVDCHYLVTYEYFVQLSWLLPDLVCCRAALGCKFHATRMNACVTVVLAGPALGQAFL